MMMIYRSDYPERTEEEEQKRQRKLDEAGERKFEERHEEIGMEQISEERQRKVYEWLYPELKEQDWQVIRMFDEPRLVSVRTETHKAVAIHAQELYLRDLSRNWQPNYQFFFTEIVPRLEKAKVRVSYNLMGCPEWYLDPETDPHMVYIHADPIAAVAEYVEALEGK